MRLRNISDPGHATRLRATITAGLYLLDDSAVCNPKHPITGCNAIGPVAVNGPAVLIQNPAVLEKCVVKHGDVRGSIALHRRAIRGELAANHQHRPASGAPGLQHAERVHGNI